MKRLRLTTRKKHKILLSNTKTLMTFKRDWVKECQCGGVSTATAFNVFIHAPNCPLHKWGTQKWI